MQNNYPYNNLSDPSPNKENKPILNHKIHHHQSTDSAQQLVVSSVLPTPPSSSLSYGPNLFDQAINVNQNLASTYFNNLFPLTDNRTMEQTVKIQSDPKRRKEDDDEEIVFIEEKVSNDSILPSTGTVGPTISSFTIPSTTTTTTTTTTMTMTSPVVPTVALYPQLRHPPCDMECPICYDTYPLEQCILLACGDIYCANCLQQHTYTEFLNGTRYRIPCPNHGSRKEEEEEVNYDHSHPNGPNSYTEGCQGYLSSIEIQAFLTPNQYATFEYRGLETLVAVNNQHYKACPVPDCTYIVAVTDQDMPNLHRFDCPVCRTVSCLRCKQYPYDGSNHTCGATSRSSNRSNVVPVTDAPSSSSSLPPVVFPTATTSSNSSTERYHINMDPRVRDDDENPLSLDNFMKFMEAQERKDSLSNDADDDENNDDTTNGPHQILTSFANTENINVNRLFRVLHRFDHHRSHSQNANEDDNENNNNLLDLYARNSSESEPFTFTLTGHGPTTTTTSSSGTSTATTATTVPTTTTFPSTVDDETQQALNALGIKMCTRCGQGVVKEVGCHKLKCRCGYRFCWVCGSENAQCNCTPASHGFYDNIQGHAIFDNLSLKQSPT